MRVYYTEIRAIDNATGHLATFAGPMVQGLTQTHAQAWCNNNKMGYCKVLGLVTTVLLEDGTELDLEKASLN